MRALVMAVALTLAAKGLLAAYAQRHGGAAAPPGLVYAMAWSIASEGAWTPYFQGSNNYGAVHASSGFYARHSEERGYGMIAMLETLSGSTHYVARMKCYPSLVVGAADFLALVEYGVDLSSVASAQDFATGLYSVGYFGGVYAPRTPLADRKEASAAGTLNDNDKKNIAAGASACQRGVAQAQAAIAGAAAETGDPSALSIGPPFASLADRLTPSPAYAPHTLEHAAELLGAQATDPPPGGVSLADCLATPTGDGVWLFAPSAPPATLGSSSGLALGVSLGVLAGSAIGLAAIAGGGSEG